MIPFTEMSRIDKSTDGKEIGAARACVREGQEWEVADDAHGFFSLGGEAASGDVLKLIVVKTAQLRIHEGIRIVQHVSSISIKLSIKKRGRMKWEQRCGEDICLKAGIDALLYERQQENDIKGSDFQALRAD